MKTLSASAALLLPLLVVVLSTTITQVHGAVSEDCTAVVADFDPFDGTDYLSLVCETPNRRLYQVVCPEITQSWILEKQASGELLSGETQLVFRDDATLLTETMNIQTTSLPTLVNPAGSRRKLARTTGVRNVVAIHIAEDGTGAGSTLSVEQIQSALFGDDNVNIKTQYPLCSHGALEMLPSQNEGVDGGVISLTVEESVESIGAFPFIQLVVQVAEELFGTAIFSNVHHVMYCSPPGTWPANGVALENSWFSGFNGDSCSYVSTTMHELGHNLNLKHASDNNYPGNAIQEYDDQVGYMGRSFTQANFPQMCFNPAKTHQLGWFDDKTVTCEPTPCNPCVLEFGGFVDYDTVDTVLVKINQASNDPDYFMTYNKATSFNHETQEGANQVVIASQALEGTGNAFSFLEAILSAGDSHTISPFNGGSIIVDVSSIGSDGVAQVIISVDEGCEEASRPPEIGGDPHITTWKNEHYEFHGQCDLVMAKDDTFADGLGIDVHIRTKLVRFWSYIKTVAIRIGSDILEIEGSADPRPTDMGNYWINYEFQGDLTEFAGFPVSNTISPTGKKRIYVIDLSSKFPGQKIEIKIYNEFVRVKFDGGKKAFGNTVGLLGDFDTGKTLARDGTTVLEDFAELGNEWQVLPAEPKLFRHTSPPQFPEKCIEPEDPRGERRRRLDENAITEEQAGAACASLKDPLSIKDCVYDILATQDIDMVGAF